MQRGGVREGGEEGEASCSGGGALEWVSTYVKLRSKPVLLRGPDEEGERGGARAGGGGGGDTGEWRRTHAKPALCRVCAGGRGRWEAAVERGCRTSVPSADPIDAHP
ncbi:hypothetical protein GW17_00054158, partial [Ensete ventricosum]